MQNTKLITLSLFFIYFSSFQCGKSEIEPNTINFNGITTTDFNAQPLGQVDATDWTLNDSWTTQERDLFNGYREVCTSVGAEEKVFSASPNPTTDGQFYLGIQAKENVGFMFRLVDKNYKILLKNDTLTFRQGFSQLSFNLPNANITVKDTLRIYYKIIRSNCEMRGHGDILVK